MAASGNPLLLRRFSYWGPSAVKEPNRDDYARQFWIETVFIAVALIAFFAAAILAVVILMG